MQPNSANWPDTMRYFQSNASFMNPGLVGY